MSRRPPEPSTAPAFTPAAEQSGYGWVVAALAFLYMAVSMGVVQSFPVYFGAILEEFGWSRAGTAGIFSLNMAVIGLSGVCVGLLLDRVPHRLVLGGGALLLGGGLGMAAMTRSAWELYPSYGVVMGLGASLLGWVPNGIILNRWFPRRRGTAIGFAYAGMGMGVLVFAPLSQSLIAAMGWRGAFRVLGGGVLAGLLPLALLLQRDPPVAGGRGRGAGTHAAAGGDIGDGPKGGEGLREAMRTGQFWCFFATFLCIGAPIFAVGAHQALFLVDRGYDRFFAAAIVGLVGALSSVGRIVFGVASDHIGRERAATISFACSVAGILILLMLPGGAPGGTATAGSRWVPAAYAYAATFGIAFGARGPILSAMVGEAFPGSRFGSIFGGISVGHGLGAALGPWVAGLLFDVTGGYEVAFGLAIASLIVACLLTWAAGRRPLP